MCFVSTDGSERPCNCDNEPYEPPGPTKSPHSCTSNDGRKCLTGDEVPEGYRYVLKTGDPCFENGATKVTIAGLKLQ